MKRAHISPKNELSNTKKGQAAPFLFGLPRDDTLAAATAAVGIATAVSTAVAVDISASVTRAGTAAGEQNDCQNDQPYPVIVEKIAKTVIHRQISFFDLERRASVACPSAIIICRISKKVPVFCRSLQFFWSSKNVEGQNVPRRIIFWQITA